MATGRINQVARQTKGDREIVRAARGGNHHHSRTNNRTQCIDKFYRLFMTKSLKNKRVNKDSRSMDGVFSFPAPGFSVKTVFF